MTRLRPVGASARQAGRPFDCAQGKPFDCAQGRRPRATGLPAVLTLLGLLVGAGPVAAQVQEVVEYYATDAVGSVRVVFNASGQVVARADYQPFGELFAPVGELPPQQFTGQARDGEAGLDYFGARFYQPRHGRFTQVDPVYAGLFDPQQWNRYTYARANPLSFVDPDGRATRPIFRSGVWEKMPSGDRPSGLWVGAFPGGEIGNIFEEGIGTDFWGDGISTWVPPTIDLDPDPCPPGDCPEPPKPPKPPGPSTPCGSPGQPACPVVSVGGEAEGPKIAAHKTPFLGKVGTCTMETLGIRQPYLYLMAAGGVPVPKVLVGLPRAGGTRASAFTSAWSAVGAHFFPGTHLPGGAKLAGTARTFGAAGRISQVLGAALLVRDAVDIGSCVREW